VPTARSRQTAASPTVSLPYVLTLPVPDRTDRGATAADKAEWKHLEDVRSMYPSADAVGEFTVINIGGNDFRLVTRIVYLHHLVYVVEVLTHAEYDKRKWR
jgi:mRNA interferase HigB